MSAIAEQNRFAPGSPACSAGPPTTAGLATAYLLPGRLIFASEPTLVSTVLGSCVSVCMWDEDAGIGGVNHYQLPTGEGVGLQEGRFAASALRALVESLGRMGAARSRLRAKVFGGARVLAASDAAGGRLGARNVEVALQWLGEARIAIASSDLGGTRGRKLIFRTDDGSAWVKRL